MEHSAYKLCAVLKKLPIVIYLFLFFASHDVVELFLGTSFEEVKKLFLCVGERHRANDFCCAELWHITDSSRFLDLLDVGLVWIVAIGFHGRCVYLGSVDGFFKRSEDADSVPAHNECLA